jgi:error-prone DNA polymerase
VLGKTLGVPLFQEQAMRLAVVAAGFTPGEADQLRRAMAAWKKRGDAMVRFGEKLVRGMEERGYAAEFAQRVFRQLKGFSEYGFPESHAASFALLVYASCWLKRYHPAAFAAALINSQPMGFYAPAQLVRDAQAHGVTVRGVDVNASHWDCTLEARDAETCTQAAGADAPPSAWGASGPAVRLGLRLVHGLGEAAAETLVKARMREGRFADVASLWRACAGRVRRADLHALARADAFASMGLSRREAIWRVRALSDESLPLFDAAAHEDAPVSLPAARSDEAVRLDYLSTGLSLKAHPISFIRERLKARGAITAQALRDERLTPAGARVMVGGIVLCRQRPGTASGVVFVTLEDETGSANIIIRPRIYTRDRAAARHAVCLAIWGTVERQGEVVHVMATRVRELAAVASMEHAPPEMSRNFR